MIETYFNNLMQEVERKMGIESSRMEGEQVIRTCQEMVSFLRERSRELKDYVLNHPFSNVEEEICFFKYFKRSIHDNGSFWIYALSALSLYHHTPSH